MKTLIVTPKKAYAHLDKIKKEMADFDTRRQEHEMRKSQPANLSLIDHMNSKGLLSHWHARKALAEKYGISNYAGTSHQNARLLAIIQANAPTNDNSPNNK